MALDPELQHASAAAPAFSVDCRKARSHVAKLQQRFLLLMQVKALDFPLTTDSYRQFQLEQIGADIKETICRVSDGPFDAEQNASIPTVSYEVRTARCCRCL